MPDYILKIAAFMEQRNLFIKPLQFELPGRASRIKPALKSLKAGTLPVRKSISLSIFIFLACTASAQIYYVQDMSTVQIDSLDRKQTVVLLPGGILEEHGPYLPSFTDGYITNDLTKQIADSIIKRKGTKVLIFPIMPLGNGGANEIGRKYNFPGSFTIRQDLLRSVLMDLSSDIGDQGFKNIFVIYTHGGPNHNQAIDQACEYFNDTYGGKMVNIMNLGNGYRANLLTKEERAEDGFSPHAGIDEHSVLYFLQPRFMAFHYKEAKPATAANPAGTEVVAKAKDWPGYFGSPRLSNVEYGEKSWKARSAFIISQVGKVLDGTYDFNQTTYFQMMEKSPAFLTINEDALKYDQQREMKQKEWMTKKGF